jgi:hypothetical protein
MKILSAFGVVEIRQADGTRVATTANPELRILVEEGIVRLAVAHADGAGLKFQEVLGSLTGNRLVANVYQFVIELLAPTMHPGQGREAHLRIVEALRREFAAQLPDVLLTSIVDDSLIRDARAAGRVTPSVAHRLVPSFAIAAEMGADLILNTCSSVGDVVPGARALFGVPIVRIDAHDGLLVEAALHRDVVTMIRRAGGPRPS